MRGSGALWMVAGVILAGCAQPGTVGVQPSGSERPVLPTYPTPSAGADVWSEAPDAEAAFLATVTTTDGRSDSELVALGRALCDSYADGATVLAATQQLVGSGVDPDTVLEVDLAARRHFCLHLDPAHQ